MHSIKGLEFKTVILAGLSDKLIPNLRLLQENDDVNYAETMERKLLYVGMTRATERLYMSCHGEPSRFISGICPQFLKIKDGAKFCSLQNIPLQKYPFADKIADIYSKEEKIRQWVLRELMETYHYPQDLLDIEYKVQVFSKIGFVDAAGRPIEMQDGMRETCTLPFEWVSAPSEMFILTVNGNSMVNAGIDHDDLVLLRKTNVVDNGQIAAVELDGNVTLKRFRSMGSFVLLIPENDEYEPMMVNQGQFRILGRAVGVIKRR